MRKKLTITIDELVYDGLYRRVGKRRISQFIEGLVRPHVMEPDLEEAYQSMAGEVMREQEADDWVEALIGDGTDEAG